MQSNEEDKRRTVLQLADIFSGQTYQDLWQICEIYKWNVHQCVERLITENKQTTAENTTTAESLPPTETTVSAALATKKTDSAAKLCFPEVDYTNADANDDSLQKYQFTQHGAIPKNHNENDTSAIVSYAEASMAAAATANNPTLTTPTTKTNSNVKNNNNCLYNNPQITWTKEYQKICEQIRANYRMMVIMRGAPGSGKSTLAEHMLRDCAITFADGMKYDISDFVLSTDDYFYQNPQGRYKFNPDVLPEAHSWNQRRVLNKAMIGWSPIIVDNTNVQLWEMMPYVQIAVQHGYIIELLEPCTAWRNSAGKLAQRNKHGVPREAIQRKLDRFEKCSVFDLLKMLKDTQYTVSLPLFRMQPIIDLRQQQGVEHVQEHQVVDNGKYEKQQAEQPESRVNDESEHNITWESYEAKDVAKPQRIRSPHKIKLESTNSARATVIAPQSFVQKEDNTEQDTNDVNSNASNNKKTLLDLLRESVRVEEPQETTVAADKEEENQMDEPKLNLQRHSVNCSNEAAGFVALRQIYPNKHLTGLWDLYVKCNGDVDWAVDILLKEDELTLNSETNFENINELDQFQCNCEVANVNSLAEDKEQLQQQLQQPQQQQQQQLQQQSLQSFNATSFLSTNIKPQRQQRSRRTNPTLQSMKQQIESCFILGDEQYSEHTRKIRDIRNGCLDTPLPIPQLPKESAESKANEDDNDDDSVEEDDPLLEIDLGEKLVAQLNDIFQLESTLGEQLPEKYATNVFIPRTLAKQLYMLWMETVYNHMEQQRQQLLHEDEQFARLIKNPKYEDFKQSPSNVNELLDMELAWTIYNNDKQRQTSEQQVNQGADLATQLTKMKLCEKYPDIPSDTVLDVFAAHNNSYSKTLEVLGQDDVQESNNLTRDELIERAMRENELLNRQSDQPPQQLQQQSNDNERSQSNNSSQHSQEDSKRLALRAFEETRNLAAHHSQMKAECYHKAKQAMRHGNGGVAFYYSQIANLHKKKVDMYNHRAANCIMDVHKYTQNNPDLLDLHYLHVLEAIGCLDLFLDQHITALRVATRPYKHVFIITGRGLHSAGGVSTIKNKVKSRLKERNLKWNEVNPGLLRVKIFSASRHAKSF